MCMYMKCIWQTAGHRKRRKNGNNYSTALTRNMGSSANGNLVQ